MAYKRPQPKEKVEELQEKFLEGPADESIAEVREKLQVDEVVVVPLMPACEKIIFRNQRDPGYPLDFHYYSKTHPFKVYKLIDGHTYTLPREVVLNLEGCRENVEKYRKNSEGLPEIYIAGYKNHFVCERVA